MSQEKLPVDLIEKIRYYVKKYNSKIDAANKLGLPYDIVLFYTKDIKIKPILSDDTILKIRGEVAKGKTKLQVARELNLHYGTVLKHTHDIPSYSHKKVDRDYPGIYGKSLDLLKELMLNGYAFCSGKYGKKEYMKLKKYFPQIQRARMYGQRIYYIDDKSKVAAKALLEVSNKKVMSYQELKQITKVFDTK